MSSLKSMPDVQSLAGSLAANYFQQHRLKCYDQRAKMRLMANDKVEAKTSQWLNIGSSVQL